jgi:hypothetical protein
VGAGGERVVAGVVERSPRESRPEEKVVGEGGDEQPEGTPTSARLDDFGYRSANYVPVIRVSEATDTHLSTGFSSCGIAGERHSDKESSGTTSDPGFPTGYPLEEETRRG